MQGYCAWTLCKDIAALPPAPQARPDPLVLDVVGAGEDLGAIQEYAAAKGLHWRWLGAKDHADPSMHCPLYNIYAADESRGGDIGRPPDSKKKKNKEASEMK